jgi:hypothetical protein
LALASDKNIGGVSGFMGLHTDEDLRLENLEKEKECWLNY